MVSDGDADDSMDDAQSQRSVATDTSSCKRGSKLTAAALQALLCENVSGARNNICLWLKEF